MELEEDSSFEEAFHDSEFHHNQHEEVAHSNCHGYSKPPSDPKLCCYSYQSRKAAM